MPDLPGRENEFLEKINDIILENLSNEQFGVSELAAKVGMSRSNLLRKIQKLTQLSASQYISKVRLTKAMEMLKESTLNVSEVAFEVGFSSTSYFIKCFREQYGYPPGEVGKGNMQVAESTAELPAKWLKPWILVASAIGLLGLAVGLFFIVRSARPQVEVIDKSIAVLPFINDSDDSSNIYIVNGLMESILINLQKIEDIRVISRTSVEKYRHMSKTIPEMGEELNVRYFVEGSGQKIGDQIRLNVQLIEAGSDKHLWAQQYSRDTRDIFQLQMEVARSIAEEIEAIITPEESERIAKVPTANLVAYDYYLKAADLMRRGTREGLEEALPWLNMAVEEDEEFALAYATQSIAYYYLNIFLAEKQNLDEISHNADMAVLYDPTLPESLVAKAMDHILSREYQQAVPYLEKALEYNPNSAEVINFLADFYTSYIPNTEKYLEYALMGVRLDIGANDSATASFTLLHVSNALIQMGFVEQAEKYVNQSLAYNPNNLFSEYVKAYILYAKNKDLQQTKYLLIAALNKDTTRLDILQEVAKVCYFMRDYESAFHYYSKFTAQRSALKMAIYTGEDAKIAFVYDQMGLKKESEQYLSSFYAAAEADQSLYRHLSMAAYFSYTGDLENAIKHLKLFSRQDDYHYWIILFLEIDPLMENVKTHPEFKKIMRSIEHKFWKRHKEVATHLKELDLV